jgi:CubicO group peptidase (beta-lactamase class C family)
MKPYPKPTASKIRKMNRILLTLTILLMMVFHSSAQINIKTVDSIANNAVDKELFEGTILVAESGNVIYHKSYGFKDYDKLLPIENSTHFGIASITKMLTAIITLQLIEEGKFILSDNLQILLPEIKIPGSTNITVHHLLLHISGLPNENDDIYKRSIRPLDFVLETILNKSNFFGEFNYTNLDYVLLGLIIEKFDDLPFEQSVQQRILDNYSMKQTGFLKKDNYPEDFAYSFSYSEDDMREADPLLFIESYYAAGSMYSSAKDLLKLDQALYDPELLTEKSKELMFTSYPEYNYSGYSVWTYNYPFAKTKPKIMERRGGILGANSVLIRMLDTNKTIIILSNNNKFNPDSFGKTQSLKEALMIEIDKSSNKH